MGLVLWFGLGLVLLIVGAEMLVRGASRLALSWGLSPLVVGLTVVAFGTSSPEFAVSVQSAWSGRVELALSNVVGSNIFNVLFILGLSALITPLLVDRQVIRQEVPIVLGTSVLLFAFALDGSISRVEGGILFASLLVYIAFLIWQARRHGDADGGDDLPAPAQGWMAHPLAQVGLIVVGLALLVQGSDWMVDAAVRFAQLLGVSDVIIGLTIVAAGTSLPEVAASLMAAVRGQRDMAVGNVVGSSIFNVLGVVGLSALVAPVALLVPPALLNFDLLVLMAVSLACLPIFFTGNVIARWEGALFFGYYVAYTTYLVLDSQGHDALDDYSLAMQTVVLPLTALTLFLVAWREWVARRTARRIRQTRRP